MNTPNSVPHGSPETAHVVDSIGAYLAGGLSADERQRFEAHVSLCAACAAAVAELERADARMRDLFDGVQPAGMFEDEIIDALRDAPLPMPVSDAAPGLIGAKRRRRLLAGNLRLPRALVHPMVRLAASGVAAAVVLGAIGFGASQGMNDGRSPFAGRLRFVDGRLKWEGGSKNAGGAVGVALSDLHRDARTANPVRYDDAVSASTPLDPAEIGRRTQLALTSDVAGGSRTPLKPGIDIVGGASLRYGTEAGNGRNPQVEFKGATGRSPTTWSDQNGDGTNSWALHDQAGEKNGPSAAVPPNFYGTAVQGNTNGAAPGTITYGDATHGQEFRAALGAPAGAGAPAAAPTNANAPAGGPGGPGGATAGGRSDAPNLDLTQNSSGAAGLGGGGSRGGGGGGGRGGFGGGSGGGGFGNQAAAGSKKGGAPSAEELAQAEQSRNSTQLGMQVDGESLQKGVKQGAGLDSMAAGVVAGGATPQLQQMQQQMAQQQKQQQQFAKELGATKATESRASTFAYEGVADLTGKDAKPGTPAEAGKPAAPANRGFKPAELWGRTDAGAAKDRPPDEPMDMLLLPTDDKSGFGETTPGAPATPKPVPAPGGGAQHAELGGGPGQSSGGPRPRPLAAPQSDPKAADQPANTPPAATPPPAPAGNANPPAQMQRKIIRNGEMTFEVDSFDSSAMQVAKIVGEEKGFVATTDSEKLQNGKVKGTITLRCPPENLDTLVLKLRGLGDLKSQKITAQDITKQYTDFESQLRAARAMETRLLDIIKNGKGEVKDIVEAQKQLGIWTEKIESLTGEIRYYDSLVSLSTLNITLFERDIKTPTQAAEVENVQMGVEADDVEKGRADAIKAIDEAKGRIIQAELKKHDANQLSATIVAEVPPDASGPLIDRLKQIGKVARLEIERKRETAGGTGPVAPAVKVERRDTRFQISLYNLANIAPRQTTNLNVAAPEVEKAYRAILDQVTAGGGRIVSSQLNRPKPDQTTGTITFEVPADKAEVLLAAVRGNGDVMRMEVTQNADTQNVTEAKRGFAVQVFSLASVAPRETTSLQLAAPNVQDSFNRLLEAAKAGGGRIITSQLNEQDQNNVNAQLDFDVMREQWGKVEAALREAGLVVTRTVARSPDVENTVDSKIRLTVTLIDAVRLQPRETITLTVATRAVPDSFNALLNLARDAGGRAINSNLSQEDKSNVRGAVLIHVPRENWQKLESSLKDVGIVVSRNIVRAADGPMTVDTKVGLAVNVMDERSIPARETQTMDVATPNVADRYNRVLDLLRSLDAQVITSQVVEQAGNNVTGKLEFAIRREDRPAVEKALFEKADVFNRTVQRAQEQQMTLENKVQYNVSLHDAERQAPRETYTIAVEVQDVDKAARNLDAAVMASGGRRVDATESADKGKHVARIVLDVPLAAAGQVLDTIRGYGNVTMSQRTRNDGVAEGSLSRAKIEVTLGTPDTIVRGEEGLGTSIREGLGTSIRGLLWTLQFIIIGLCLVVPWVLLLWLAWTLIRRARGRRAIATTPTPPGGPAMPPPPAGPPPGAGPIVAPA